MEDMIFMEHSTLEIEEKNGAVCCLLVGYFHGETQDKRTHGF